MKNSVYIVLGIMMISSCSKEPEQVDEKCDEPTEWGVIDLNKMQDEGKWQGPK